MRYLWLVSKDIATTDYLLLELFLAYFNVNFDHIKANYDLRIWTWYRDLSWFLLRCCKKRKQYLFFVLNPVRIFKKNLLMTMNVWFYWLYLKKNTNKKSINKSWSKKKSRRKKQRSLLQFNWTLWLFFGWWILFGIWLWRFLYLYIPPVFDDCHIRVILLMFLCRGSDSILDVAQYIENESAVFSSLVWPRQYLQFLYLCHLFEYMAYLIFNYVFFSYSINKSSAVGLPLYNKRT